MSDMKEGSAAEIDHVGVGHTAPTRSQHAPATDLEHEIEEYETRPVDFRTVMACVVWSSLILMARAPLKLTEYIGSGLHLRGMSLLVCAALGHSLDHQRGHWTIGSDQLDCHGVVLGCSSGHHHRRTLQ